MGGHSRWILVIWLQANSHAEDTDSSNERRQKRRTSTGKDHRSHIMSCLLCSSCCA